jgi:anthranilate/para-aminobenzoate synthase component II
MKLLIVNNSNTICNYSKLEWYGTIQYINYKELPNTNIELLLSNINAILITGGSQHIPNIENYPELQFELKLIDIAIKKSIKIIGICLGFQLINYYFGNKVIKLSKFCIGHHLLDINTIDTNNIPNLDIKLLESAFSFHYDGIIDNTNPDIQILARSKPLEEYQNGLIYFIKHCKYPIFAIQNHPDADLNNIKKCIQQCLIEYNTFWTEEHYNKIFNNFFKLLLD